VFDALQLREQFVGMSVGQRVPRRAPGMQPYAAGSIPFNSTTHEKAVRLEA
jgi:hypothetical protein